MLTEWNVIAPNNIKKISSLVLFIARSEESGSGRGFSSQKIQL